MALACGVKGVVLIGGEPTLHPDLLRIIDEVHLRKMTLAIVSNGLRFADKDFAESVFEHFGERDSINISIKGGTVSQYEESTGSGKAFNSVMAALKLLRESSVRTSLSIVATIENVRGLGAFVKELHERSNLPIGISFCGPCLSKSTIENSLTMEDRRRLAQECFSVLSGTMANPTVHLNMPICQIEEGVLSQALQDCSIKTGCHVLNRSGIIFDTNGDCLLCNHLLGAPVGFIDKDYSTPAEFRNFLSSSRYKKLWRTLTQLPYKNCSSCSSLLACGGGCPLVHF